MPQMMPMNWMILMNIFLLMLMTLMIMLNLYPINTPMTKTYKKLMMTKKYYNKW